MIGKFASSHLTVCISLLLGLSQDAAAGAAYSEFKKPHHTKTSKLGSGAEVVIHRFGEFKLVELFVPAGISRVTVHDLQTKGVASEAYEQITDEDTLAVVGGGFFGYDNDGAETPIGLVRESGERKIALMPWDHGGVLTSDGEGAVRIFPANNASQGGRWSYALQSKPIIILNGNVDVGKNLRDAEFNRVAVGTTREGDLLIVGLFNSFGQAGTLVQFSNIYKFVADKRNLHVLRALAMDGGAGAQIHIPKLKMRFGDTGMSYFPNAIRVSAKLWRENKK